MSLKLASRAYNFYEKALLLVGLGVIALGFFFINRVFSSNSEVGWAMLQSIFLWLILIVLIVLLATEEDVKEELGIIIKQGIEETKILKEETVLLRTISAEQLEELRLMRKGKKK